MSKGLNPEFDLWPFCYSFHLFEGGMGSIASLSTPFCQHLEMPSALFLVSPP